MDKNYTKLNFYCMWMVLMAINSYNCYLNDLDKFQFE
jgi:hypothetical protein